MKYVELYPTIMVAAITVCILLTLLAISVAKGHQAQAEINRLVGEKFNLAYENRKLNNINAFWMDQVKFAGDRCAALSMENAQLRKDISETEDELTAARATRKPVDPKQLKAWELIAQIVAAEAGPDADYEECEAIAQVVINRWHATPHISMLDVIKAPGQFSPVASGAWLWAQPTVQESAAAWNTFDGSRDSSRANVVADDVLFFCSAKTYQTNEFFQSLEKVTQIGDTVFCRARK